MSNLQACWIRKVKILKWPSSFVHFSQIVQHKGICLLYILVIHSFISPHMGRGLNIVRFVILVRIKNLALCAHYIFLLIHNEWFKLPLQCSHFTFSATYIKNNHKFHPIPCSHFFQTWQYNLCIQNTHTTSKTKQPAHLFQPQHYMHIMIKSVPYLTIFLLNLAPPNPIE